MFPDWLGFCINPYNFDQQPSPGGATLGTPHLPDVISLDGWNSKVNKVLGRSQLFMEAEAVVLVMRMMMINWSCELERKTCFSFFLFQPPLTLPHWPPPLPPLLPHTPQLLSTSSLILNPLHGNVPREHYASLPGQTPRLSKCFHCHSSLFLSIVPATLSVNKVGQVHVCLGRIIISLNRHNAYKAKSFNVFICIGCDFQCSEQFAQEVLEAFKTSFLIRKHQT